MKKEGEKYNINRIPSSKFYSYLFEIPRWGYIYGTSIYDYMI